MRKFFLTLGYSGLSPKAPGSVGSLIALILGVLFLHYYPYSDANFTLLLFSILISIVAIREIDKYERESQTHDDKSIVIDELVGMWIALAISSGTILQILLSFIFFRYFDIKKPSIIGRADRELKGGLGVVLDDVLAGVFGGLLSALVYTLAKESALIG